MVPAPRAASTSNPGPETSAMIRHDLLTTIHPAKASLQETKPHALTGGYDAAPNQKGGNMCRLCYAFRTECPPL